MANGVMMEREGTPQGPRFPRSWPTCYWLKWIRNWNGEGTDLPGTPTIAMSMFSVGGQESGFFAH